MTTLIRTTTIMDTIMTTLILTTLTKLPRDHCSPG